MVGSLYIVIGVATALAICRVNRTVPGTPLSRRDIFWAAGLWPVLMVTLVIMLAVTYRRSRCARRIRKIHDRMMTYVEWTHGGDRR